MFQQILNELEMSDSHLRSYFNINRCFICNVSAVETSLKCCSACKMISYCGETHQKKHWGSHKKFCKVIKKIEKNLPQDNLDDKKKWATYRSMLVVQCEKELKRKLEKCEILMIQFPKRCEICRATNAKIVCEKCLCVNYCSIEHRNMDSAFHVKNCDALKLAMDIDMNFNSAIRVNCMWSLRKCSLKLPEKIQDFIKGGIKRGNVMPNQKNLAEAQISKEITFPLSLAYGLHWLNFVVKDKLVIHLVGCQAEEVLNLTAWEIILHIYPQIKNLTIFFTGPEISEPFMESETYKIVQMECMCPPCKEAFKYEIVKDLYQDFVKSADYKQPDVVCAFNPGFQHYEKFPSVPWKQTLPLLLKNAPLIVTAFNEWEMDLNLKVIQDVNSNVIFRKQKNPFASLLPIRSLEESVVDYLNNFISVIFKKNLTEHGKSSV